MKSNIAAAIIVAIGLIVGGFLAGGGRYMFMKTETNALTRVDRYTGSISMCVPGTSGTGCGWEDVPPDQNSN